MSGYFPVSHNLNSDPEVWELTERFGDRALRVWLEILSLADRNRGAELKGSVEGWAKVLLRVYSKGNPKWVRRDSETLQKALRWLSEKGWIAIREGSEPSLRVVKYAKYHKIKAEQNLSPNPPNLPNLPDSSHKNAQSQKNAPPSAGPSADLKISEKERKEIMGRPVSSDWSPELKAVSDAIYYSDKVKFKDLVNWVMQGKKHGYPESELIATLKKFWDYRDREDWYPYLDTILLNVHQDFNRDQSEREHRRQIEELKQQSRNGDSGIATVVRGIADAKKLN